MQQNKHGQGNGSKNNHNISTPSNPANNQNTPTSNANGNGNYNNSGQGLRHGSSSGSGSGGHRTSTSHSKEDDKGGLLGFIFGGKKEQNGRQSMGGGIGSPGHIVKLPQVPDTMTMKSELPSDRERIETEIIKSLIESYFNIVRKNFLDLVPKTIMYFLVNHSRDSVQNELVSELYKDDHIQDLMKETDDIAQRRKTCREMRELLQRALEIVNEVRDFNNFK